ncbi:spermidine synthase [Brackiella oedipodis]|uniref:spermine/spermidine synthase domain-containing protein n=1 Tax=Brackiella oedipodis TaxID=124225 RepID=UPI001FE0B946|nr:spermidine synthase [Brackiella oedipodis]
MLAKHPHPEHDSPLISEAEGYRYLHFASAWMQGAMDIRTPSNLVFEYTRQMAAWLLFITPSAKDRLAILGLGSASLLRFFMRYSRSQLQVVEWNPQVTACCRQYFRMPDSPRINVHHGDAQAWVVDPVNHGTCKVLMVDLYNYQAEGPVCSSLAFYKGCYDTLENGGIAVINLFANHASFAKNLKNIQKAFGQRLLMLKETPEGNRIVMAFKGPPRLLRWSQLQSQSRKVQVKYGLEACEFLMQLRPELKKYAQDAHNQVFEL